ncbi:hypothetical protein LCGC14_2382920 [marine sediment metagenome]|uniref:Uncharacterized protein n=1 Tax=marine sediment metagenome TaxID=412755 RepID=A0A0F9CMI9_9ZZZZ
MEETIAQSVDLASYEVILLNSSGGKDSQDVLAETVRLAREAEDVASDLEGWLRRNRVIAPLAIVLRGARYELADSGLYGYGGGGRRPYYRRMLYRLRRSMDRATGPELEAMIDAIEDLQERQREVDEE